MKYIIENRTLFNNLCRIVLTTSDDSDDVVTLTGASESFEMETDNDTSVDIILRATTGVVRFIVTDETILEDILPSNAFGTKVEVTLYDENGENGVLKFFGYIEMTEYSQDWDSTPFEMELPVRDSVSLLEETQMSLNDDAYFGKSCTMARYLMEAMESVGFEPSEVYIESDDNLLLSQQIQREWFIETQTTTNEQTSTSESVGLCFNEILEKILKANGMMLWVEGSIVRIARIDLSMSVYYSYLWDEIKTIADGGSASGSYKSIVFLSGLDSNLVNMSASNTMGYLPAAHSVAVTQSLDEVSLFELSRDWLRDWRLETVVAGVSNYNTVLWLWRNSISQRGVNIRRGYRNDEGGWTNLPDSTSIGIEYNGNAVIGGALCDLPSYGTDEEKTQENLPVAENMAIVFQYTNIYLADDADLSDSWAFLDVKCPVQINAAMGGCICLTATVKTIRTQDTTSADGVTYLPCDGPRTQYGCMLYARIDLIGENGERYRWRDAYVDKDTQEEHSCLWVKDDDFFTYLMFGTDGKITPNFTDNEGSIHVRVDGDDSEHTFGYPCYYLTNKGGISQSDRFKFKDGEGYFMPLDSLPSDLGNCTLQIKLFGTWDHADRNIYEWAHFHWLDHYQIMQSISDIKVTWHPICVEGVLPNPGTDPSGTYSATYFPLADNTRHVCIYTSKGGDDVTIELDTWGDGSYKKWGNTLQPNLCRTDVFDIISKQLTSVRKTVEYDDASDGVEVPAAYTQSYGGRNIVFRKIGNSWKASNEGGTKKFIQIV